MSDDTAEPFLFPAVRRKKVTAAFDGGRLTSDGGVMLLAAAERRLGIADTLAGLIADPRNPLFVTHSVADILRARMLAIACGYEDADDLDHLRTDPGGTEVGHDAERSARRLLAESDHVYPDGSARGLGFGLCQHYPIEPQSEADPR